MGSRTAVLAAVETTASDSERDGISKCEIVRRTMRINLKEASWLTDLQQSGKLPEEFKDLNALKSSGWMTSRLSPCGPNMIDRLVGWTPGTETNATSMTRSTLRPPGMQQGLQAVSSG